jgi:acetyltransferase-like isoleucine patch superfamily enzyme
MSFLNYKRAAGNQIIVNEIDASATWGIDTIIWHYAIVLQEVRIGDHCSIGSRCEIGRGSTIGHYTRIGSGTFLPPNSTIGDRVFIGPNCTFTDDRHPKIPAPGDPPYRAEPPVVEDGAVIGAHCTIMPGAHISAGAVVAAGSLVNGYVHAGLMVKGRPAKPFSPSSRTRAAYQT